MATVDRIGAGLDTVAPWRPGAGVVQVNVRARLLREPSRTWRSCSDRQPPSGEHRVRLPRGRQVRSQAGCSASDQEVIETAGRLNGRSRLDSGAATGLHELAGAADELVLEVTGGPGSAREAPDATSILDLADERPDDLLAVVEGAAGLRGGRGVRVVKRRGVLRERAAPAGRRPRVVRHVARGDRHRDRPPRVRRRSPRTRRRHGRGVRRAGRRSLLRRGDGARSAQRAQHASQT